jgi:hypothetical protein
MKASFDGFGLGSQALSGRLFRLDIVDRSQTL